MRSARTGLPLPAAAFAALVLAACAGGAEKPIPVAPPRPPAPRVVMSPPVATPAPTRPRTRRAAAPVPRPKPGTAPVDTATAPAPSAPPPADDAAPAQPEKAVTVPAPDLVGQTTQQIEARLGPPSRVQERAPARIWRWETAGCTVEVAFYLDVNRGSFYALQAARTAVPGVACGGAPAQAETTAPAATGSSR